MHILPLYRALLKENKTYQKKYNPNISGTIDKELFEVNEDWFPKSMINSIPMRLQRLLKQGNQYRLFTSKVIKAQTSNNFSTTKLLIELQDGKLIESVIMRHDGRSTLCVSSQVGCKMGCTFCATGTLGLNGNVTTGEIIEQLVYANRIENIRNVVFMGEGEPLDNADNVFNAIQFMTNHSTFSIARNRVTLSTVGVIPALKKLRKEAPYITLAVSLHAPNQKLRETIVPTAKNWKLSALMNEIDLYNKTVFIEYILLSGINDTIPIAHELGKLMQNRKVKVNLIPYNETNLFDYKEPLEKDIQIFKNILIKEYNVFCTVRKHMGRDIDSACGQLALKSSKKSNQDIEDILIDPFKLNKTTSGKSIKIIQKKKKKKKR